MEPDEAHFSTASNFCVSTPGTISKRKRKIMQDTPDAFRSPIKPLDWSAYSPMQTFESRGILSSTHNESFTHNFENFTINSKGDDSVWLNTTVPATPTKSTAAGCSTLLSSTSKLAPSVKLGSPERNSILYPALRSTRKQRSPFKFLDFASTKRNSPAKKRLFNAQTPLHTVTQADPVEKLNADSMSVVYLFLDDSDLYTCINVCKSWRSSVVCDKVANSRLENFSIAKELNKENFGSVRKDYKGKDSMEWADENCVKEQGKILQYYTLSRTLSEDQSLLKCAYCQNVAIVTDSISQCQSRNCNYITCLKCGSFSTSGHLHFLDKCRQMKLELDTPEHHATPEKRRNTFSATNSSTVLTPYSSNSSGYSSGYFTDSTGSNHSLANVNTSSTQRRMSEINLNYLELKRTVLAPSSVPNLPTRVPKLKLVPTGGSGGENKAPPSPPSPPSPSTRREKRVTSFKANRKATKKSLRRLLL